jgi:Zn-dependent M28 family amino/carboxypeptidase
LLGFSLALLWTLSSPWASPGTGAARADSPGTATISATQMKDYLSFIASDEMEGRATPSRGLDTTAKFIATMLARWGVKPAGDDGTYFQKIAMSAKRPVSEGASATFSGHKLTYGEDYFTRSTSSAGSASGPLVYAGDGWMVKAQNRDAFRGLDVKGKIVVVNLGTGRGFGRLQGKSGVDYADAATNAQSKGAVGLLFLAGDNTNWAALQKANDQVRFGVDRFAENPGAPEAGLPTLILKRSAASQLFAGERTEADDLFKAFLAGKPVDGFDLKPDKQFTFTTAVETVKATSQNVVGVVEGSDPALKSEYVGLSAHYDHLGVTETPVNGDRVYNGADDDGSGIVAVLSVAEAASHAARRPKRSLLFIWHMGEERGLWGSRYFTMFPTVPLKRVSALINIDMIGRSRHDGDDSPANRELTGPNAIYVIGATMMSTELDNLCRKVNDKYLKLAYDFKYDDPKDPNRFFYRSDHINYARQGIPILFFFDGVHEDYHRLGDEVSKIDFDKMEHVTRTIYQTLWELASLHERLKLDKPTPSQLRPQ